MQDTQNTAAAPPVALDSAAFPSPALAAPTESSAPPPVLATRTPRRIPHLGHLALLGALLLGGLIFAVLLILVGVHFRLFGVSRLEDAMHSMTYAVGTMAAWYLVALAPAVVIFPALWRKGFLAGLQWNASVPRRRWPLLLATGFACFLLAVASKAVLHFPDDSPITGLMSTSQAVWIMFAFAVTAAPLCEEIMFRGFLLPALSTAFDWTGERLTGRQPRLPGPGDHPRWSLPAMLLASILTSIAFALIHASQIGNSLGPLVLIFSVSLILCAVRLRTRSVAASALTHAAYNFTLFALMAVSTHGFQHLHK